MVPSCSGGTLVVLFFRSGPTTTQERSSTMSKILNISANQQRVIVLFILSFAAMC
ncbi:MAG: hypothetical protein QM783_11900 [Phycisphaerales bacterium]